MVRLLCSLFVICLVLQVSSQPPEKPTGEFSPDLPEKYPNPWVKSQECKVKTGASGFCDYNGILSDGDRTYFSGQPELVVSDKPCLCNLTCGNGTGINITVAIMKKIGPHITDYRAAAREFAEKFRDMWSLNNCSVILVISKDDTTSFLEAGVGNELLVNKTIEINMIIYDDYFSKGRIAEGINATLNQYREWLTELEAKKQEKEDEKIAEESRDSSARIIVVVIVVVVVVLIVVVLVIIVIKKRQSNAHNMHGEDKAKERLNAPKAV